MRTVECESGLRGLRSLALGTASAAIWPSYLLLLAYTARQAPWPRSVAILVSAALVGVSLAVLVDGLLKWLTRPSGWAECYLEIPAPVARQLGRAGRIVVIAAAAMILPVYLLDNGLIMPEGRTLHAPAFGRFLILAFEVSVWGTWFWLLRGRSALLGWFAIDPAEATADAPAADGSTDRSTTTDGRAATSRFRAGLVWLSRRRRIAAALVLSAVAAVIVLDARGYSFSARRIAVGGSQTGAVIVLGIAAYRVLVRIVVHHAERWARPRRRSWAFALAAGVAMRGRSRRPASGPDAAGGSAEPDDPANFAVQPEDFAAGLCRLGAWALTLLGLLVVAWLWDLDPAFARFLLNQAVWSFDDQSPVTIGDLTEAAAFILAGALAWRYMSTFFALTLFHRMPDDPGVRFAVVTLCRYAVLALTTIAAMGAIRLDMAKISVVLAALGVGLGFGLQEILSNFVCGIILLLERPIRIGDTVTVAGTTGRVDRIHIRATTIINGDNQCMIVPNREFITGNLVNWTHKDKILRVPIKFGVAFGTEPDKVVDLLLSVARRDPDVLFSPAPTAALEGFGESSLLFALYAFVPDPGLVGPVRHRLCSEIQRRFAEKGIVIPVPTHELHVSRMFDESPRDPEPPLPLRYEPGSRTPPEPHVQIARPRTDESSIVDRDPLHGRAGV